MYLKDANSVILCYDITNEKSFDNLKYEFTFIKRDSVLTGDENLYLVGTHSEMVINAEVKFVES